MRWREEYVRVREAHALIYNETQSISWERMGPSK